MDNNTSPSVRKLFIFMPAQCFPGAVSATYGQFELGQVTNLSEPFFFICEKSSFLTRELSLSNAL